MEKKDIYEMMEKFEHSQLAEIELDMHGVRLVMKKGVQDNTPMERIENIRVNTTNMKSVEIEEDVNEKTIKAPLVGTFYRAPSPDEKPYIEVGSVVKKGDVIGIIEAMKLMNEIAAPEDGEIVAIEIENGEMVEYDQVIVKYK